MANEAAKGTDTASTQRVRAALLAAGHPDTVQKFPDGTRTSADAAAAARANEKRLPDPAAASGARAQEKKP